MKKELDNGLVLRTATTEDLPSILDQILNAHDEIVAELAASVYRRMADFKLEDAFIVVDSKSGKVVSHLILLPVTWIIDGTEISAAEMGIVGTRKEYRNRGLIRELNDLYEERVAQRGSLISVIAGIPYFYRIFGYAYAASLGGELVVPLELIPLLKDGEKEPISIMRVRKKNLASYLRFREMHAPRRTWYRKFGSLEYNYVDYADLSLRSCAYNFFAVMQASEIVGMFSLRCDEGILNIAEVFLQNPEHITGVLRYVKLRASELGATAIRLMPPNQEAIREIAMRIARNRFPRAYAWYVKIPSVVRFLEAMSPVLSRRLKGTEYEDFTGKLVISDYRVSYAFQFRSGILQKVTEGKDEGAGQFDAALPIDMLTRLLMGYESLDEIQLHEPDVSCRAAVKPIVRILFPKVEASIEPQY